MKPETKTRHNGKTGSDRMKKAWETRRAKMAAKEAERQNKEGQQQIDFQLPSVEVQREILSQALKKTWENMEAKLEAKAKEAESQIKEEPQKIGFQIPGSEVKKEILSQFLEYIDFSIKYKDSGVLNTEKFKALLAHIKPYLKDQIK